MAYLENMMLSGTNTSYYAWYMEDIFLLIKHVVLKKLSKVNLSLVLSKNLVLTKRILFIDILIDYNNQNYITSIYKKHSRINSYLLK